MYSHHSAVPCLPVSKPTQQGMQHTGGTGAKEEPRKAAEGVYVLSSCCAWGLSSSVSELARQSLHKPVIFRLLRPVLPVPPRPAARPAFPWARGAASRLGPSSPASVLLMETSLREGQEVKKRGGRISCVGGWLPGCLLVLNKVVVQAVSQ